MPFCRALVGSKEIEVFHRWLDTTNLCRWNGGFLTWGYPQIIHFSRIFPYKPSSYWNLTIGFNHPKSGALSTRPTWKVECRRRRPRWNGFNRHRMTMIRHVWRVRFKNGLDEWVIGSDRWYLILTWYMQSIGWINSSSLAPELLDGLERYGVSPAKIGLQWGQRGSTGQLGGWSGPLCHHHESFRPATGGQLMIFFWYLEPGSA